MNFLFSPDSIEGKKYKKLVHYLCNVADVIYFTFYEDLSLNDKVLELEQNGKRIRVPKRIRERFDADVFGYEIDDYIAKFIFQYNSFYDLLRDRPYGTVLFYSGNNEIIHIELEVFDDIYVDTNDNNLIKEFTDIQFGS